MTGRIRHLVTTATALAGLLPIAAAAQTTENRFGGTASITGAYSNNPFSEAGGGGTSSPLVTLDVTPRYEHLTARSVLSVFADANFQQYLRRYGRNESYAGGVDYTLRPAARITTHLRLDLQSQVLGSFNNFVPTPAPILATPATGTGTDTPAAASGATPAPIVTPVVDPGLLLPSTSPLITDVGLYGLRTRRRSARLGGDASVGVTDRDSLTFSANAEVARYGRSAGLVLGDYEDYSGTVGYSRRVSAYFNVGLQGSASLFDYHRSNQGNTRAYSIQATASGRLNPFWTFNGALGVSFVDGSVAGSTRATSLSGNANLCRRGQRSTMCAQVARQVSPTGFGSSQYVTSAGLNWSEQLDERSSLSLTASYSKVGGNDRLLLPGDIPLDTEYGQGSLGYSRLLRPRLNFVASANVSQLFGGGNGNRAVNAGGQAGFSYRFGGLR